MNTKVHFDPAAVLQSGGYLREIAGDDFELIVEAAHLAEKENIGLLLSGNTGCGKTLAMSILSPKSDRTRWVRCFDPVNVSWLETEKPDDLSRLRKYVLDDLGCEPTENRFGVIVEPVANFILRYDSLSDTGKLPRLFITTNMSSAQICKRYGERVISRILSAVVPVHLDGKDHRIKHRLKDF